MWKPGSMGAVMGWHHGQAEEMLHVAERYRREGWEHHYPHYEERDGNVIGHFLRGLAEEVGVNIADKVTQETT